MTIGQKIRTIRKEKGISQKKLSELTGIAEITIRQYEAGKFNPKVQQVEKIAAALDVKPVELMVEYWDSTFDIGSLSDEIKLLEEHPAIGQFLSLNDEGQRKASEYIEDLVQMDKYKK